MSHEATKKCHKTIFSYLSHSAVVIPCKSASPVPIQENRGGRERPPPKAGGYVAPVEASLSHASTRPPWGRSRPYLSLREGSEKTPRGAALKEGGTDLLK